jgi:hypothetical protein
VDEWKTLLEGRWQVVALPAVLGSAGLTFHLPAGAVSQIGSFCFTLVTDGNAANRQVVVEVVDGLKVPVFAVAAPAVQAASLTVVYSFAPLVPAFGTAALGAMGGPFISRAAEADNLTVTVTVGAHQVGDKITGGRLLAKQRVKPGVFLGADA